MTIPKGERYATITEQGNNGFPDVGTLVCDFDEGDMYEITAYLWQINTGKNGQSNWSTVTVKLVPDAPWDEYGAKLSFESDDDDDDDETPEEPDYDPDDYDVDNYPEYFDGN